MDARNTTGHWAYTRYMDAFQALADAEGRTDITKELLEQLEARIHRQKPDDLTSVINSMNLRAGWINDIIDRTRQWHHAHPLAVSEFSRYVEVQGCDASFYNEAKHRRFLANCNNFSLKDGAYVIPDMQHSHNDCAIFRSPEYDAWKAECQRLSSTRNDGEIRSADIIPTPKGIIKHHNTWRNWREAVRAHQEDPLPWKRGR